MEAVLLLALGGAFLWLSLDLLFLGWWLDKYDQHNHEKQNAEGPGGTKVPAGDNLARRSRAMFYRGLSILPERGDTGAAVMLVGAMGLGLFVKGLSAWLT